MANIALYSPHYKIMQPFQILIVPILLLIPLLSLHPALLHILVFQTALAIYHSSALLDHSESWGASEHAFQKLRELPPSTPLVWSQVGQSMVHQSRDYVPSRWIRFFRVLRKIGFVICVLYFVNLALRYYFPTPDYTLPPKECIYDFEGYIFDDLFRMRIPSSSDAPIPTSTFEPQSTANVENVLYESGSRIMDRISSFFTRGSNGFSIDFNVQFRVKNT